MQVLLLEKVVLCRETHKNECIAWNLPGKERVEFMENAENVFFFWESCFLECSPF